MSGQVNASFASYQSRLASLVPSWDLKLVSNPRPIARGLSNLNFSLRYHGVDYVLRLGREGFQANPAERHAWQQLGHRLPTLVAADWRGGDLLSKRVPAPCLGEVSPSIGQLAEFLRSLHVDMPQRLSNDYRLDEFLQDKAIKLRAKGLLEKSIERRLAQLPAIHFVSEACHNDLNAWNILVSGNNPARWIALDWEWAGNYSRLFDAVNLALFFRRQVSDAREVARLCGYLDQSRYGPFEAMVERYWLREHLFAAWEVATGKYSPFLEEQLKLTASALARNSHQSA